MSTIVAVSGRATGAQLPRDGGARPRSHAHRTTNERIRSLVLRFDAAAGQRRLFRWGQRANHPEANQSMFAGSMRSERLQFDGPARINLCIKLYVITYFSHNPRHVVCLSEA